ncbi:MAG: hypothetical protein WBI77_03180 [Tepidanaerobacteraceae bacterium]
MLIGTNVVWAACRISFGHLAGCQIVREPMRSEGPSFRTTGLDFGRLPLLHRISHDKQNHFVMPLS